MYPLSFVKVEGLGNDFLLLDVRHCPLDLEPLAARAPMLCDRRLGVGGDGLLVIAPPRTPGAAGTMIVVNHDGSRPEMCGNGLRCVALFLANTDPEVLVDTDAGPRACRVLHRAVDGRSGEVEVDMGPALHLGPHRIADREFLAVSLGNPHVVTFVGRDEDPEALARELGPGIERDRRFPDRTNVEFARLEADRSLTLWVWERGCGITAACGTGACATVAAAARQGLVAPDTAVRVQLPGGPLQVRLAGDRVWMTGPARQVFHGTLP
jgi:diaminopimelate epimerase